MPRLPAEWEPQAAVMLTWPHAGTDWAARLPVIEALYDELAAAIARFEPVLICCRDAAHRAAVEARLAAAGVAPERRRLAIAASDDTWARDHGPITVLAEGGAELVDFRFNGWGGKYPAERDDRITATLHAAGVFGAVPRRAIDLVLEGGAIESDGQGTLLAMTRTLVDDHRNPARERAAIEAVLAETLGASRFLWLEHGQLSGDDTDGHIDTLARFCAPDTIAYVRCDDPSDPDHAGLAAMERELQAFRRADGRPYRLVALPHPRPVHNAQGERLAAGYANFLIINGAVLVPVYDDAADEAALRVIADLFPGRAVVPLDARPLIEQGGSLHCLTMQLPAALTLAEAGTPAQT
ncbi:peptidylarginine deiminase-like enzyme [Thioflavicoccus mobilis 8321]|uniref:Peptidylarginine deiminase-like enzyme n=1 Tax=Thioflavicoccus mobilis 8321 TaxID=765912 RepID=L0GQQ6_9GAMM|nr:agmatine deiminase family protein [Thioflavicoccus mobilis]AGA89068.1 peptidylarginine deiminase-like enzyme [Thioflavicoccus mobilis 8321]